MSSSTFAPTGFDASRPPPSAGLGRGFALALLAHGLLVIALTAGVQWRSKTEPAFEAELWAAVPVAAAPREEAPPPEPEPVVKPAPAKPEPPPPDLQAQRDAEIAIAKAREKKREELEAKRLAELEEQRKQKLRELQEQKDKAAKDAKALKDQQAKEQKLKDDKARQDSKKAEALAEKRAEAQRQENLRRIQGMAGASGGPQATGTALQSAGPSPSYGGRIKARIRPNIIYSEAGAGNPVAEVEVRAAADGHIIGRKLLKSSGDAEWDKAVLRAIDKTEILPRDVDGRVPSVLVITFQPKD